MRIKASDRLNKWYGMVYPYEVIGKNKWGHAIVKFKCAGDERCGCVGGGVGLLSQILKGHKKSCGCTLKENLVDKVFGRLKVLSFRGARGNVMYWRCICSCGNYVIVSANSLRDGGTKSCGCLQKEAASISCKNRAKSFEYAMLSHIISEMRKSKDKVNKIVELSRSQVLNLIHQPCRYCGDVDTKIKMMKDSIVHFGKEYRCNGVDRVDPSMGYTVDNSVSCCRSCNCAKWDYSLEKFKQHIIKIYNHLHLGFRDEEFFSGLGI